MAYKVDVPQEARVFRNGRSQAVRIPAAFRFTSDKVYIQRDPETGVVTLSETSPRPSLADIFRAFDEAGGADFTLERDHSLPRDIEL